MAKKAAKTVRVQKKTRMAATGKVTVAKTGDVCQLDPYNAQTLSQAIKNAGYKVDAVAEIRVNGKRVKNMEMTLEVEDNVTLLGKIAGA